MVGNWGRLAQGGVKRTQKPNHSRKKHQPASFSPGRQSPLVFMAKFALIILEELAI